jgi:MraZ protein
VRRLFLGTHHPRLDDKGRLFLPAKFRDDLAEGIVITKGQEHCLFGWTRAEFDRFTAPYRDAPLSNKAARDYLRMLYASAEEEVPDKQGRITIPPRLRTYAGLTRDVAVVGAATRIEIWNAEAWARYEAEHEPGFADIREEVFPGI